MSPFGGDEPKRNAQALTSASSLEPLLKTRAVPGTSAMIPVATSACEVPILVASEVDGSPEPRSFQSSGRALAPEGKTPQLVVQLPSTVLATGESNSNRELSLTTDACADGAYAP